MSVILLMFVLIAGCDLKAPNAPTMASAKADVEQCPLPILDIQGKWRGGGARAGYAVPPPVITDTLQINALDREREPGIVYYAYMIEAYSDERWSEGYENLPPNHRWYREDGTMGVHYAGSGKWAFHYTIQRIRIWDDETGEYKEHEDYSPSWDHDLRMFDDWLALGWGWEGDYLDYRRVHE